MEKSSFASEKLVANLKDPLDVAVMKLIGGEKYLKIWRKKFGDLSNFAKFAKLFSHQTFVLYGIWESRQLLYCHKTYGICNFPVFNLYLNCSY